MSNANAGPVLAKLEYCLQVVWPDSRVQVASVTDQYAAIAVAGPKSRDVMRRLVDMDISNEAFPFMAAAPCRFADVPDARLWDWRRWTAKPGSGPALSWSRIPMLRHRWPCWAM